MLSSLVVAGGEGFALMFSYDMRSFIIMAYIGLEDPTAGKTRKAVVSWLALNGDHNVPAMVKCRCENGGWLITEGMLHEKRRAASSKLGKVELLASSQVVPLAEDTGEGRLCCHWRSPFWSKLEKALRHWCPRLDHGYKDSARSKVWIMTAPTPTPARY